MRSQDKVRYGDTDRQGHVNNAVFSTFLETGRVEMMHDPEHPLDRPGTEYVLVNLSLDLQAELQWPGMVDIGTGVEHVGTTSFRVAQAIFQNGTRAATARTTVVLLDTATRRPTPLDETTRARLARLTVE